MSGMPNKSPPLALVRQRSLIRAAPGTSNFQRHSMSVLKFRYEHHNIPSSAFPIPNFAALIEIERGTAWSLIKVVACRAIIRPAAAAPGHPCRPLGPSINDVCGGGQPTRGH